MNQYDVILGQVWNTQENVITVKNDKIELRYFTQHDNVYIKYSNQEMKLDYLPNIRKIQDKFKAAFLLLQEFALVHGGL